MEWLDRKINKYENDPEFLTEQQIIDFNELIVARMEEIGMSRAELSRRLDVSRAFITKVLNGNPNMTIKTMVSIANSLGCRINMDIYPREFRIARKAAYLYASDEYLEFVPALEEEMNACAA